MISPCCLSLYPLPPLIFVRGLMRSLCRLFAPPPNFFVFYVVHVVSKESRQLILPRTSCIYCEIPFLSVCHCAPSPSIFDFCVVRVVSEGSIVISFSQNFLYTIHVIKFVLLSWVLLKCHQVVGMDLEGRGHAHIYVVT
jgi:hypothetical protein